MLNKNIFTGAVLAILAPAAAFAQTNAPGGAASGAATGAIGGAIVGGPIGAAVGAVGGAIVGGIVGDQQPQFRQYVVTQVPQSYRYESDIRVGAVLPETGVCSTVAAPSAGSASSCCGGPAPVEIEACCAADAVAKAEGKAGCGCNQPVIAPLVPAGAGCCG